MGGQEAGRWRFAGRFVHAATVQPNHYPAKSLKKEITLRVGYPFWVHVCTTQLHDAFWEHDRDFLLWQYAPKQGPLQGGGFPTKKTPSDARRPRPQLQVGPGASAVQGSSSVHAWCPGPKP